MGPDYKTHSSLDSVVEQEDIGCDDSDLHDAIAAAERAAIRERLDPWVASSDGGLALVSSSPRGVVEGGSQRRGMRHASNATSSADMAAAPVLDVFGDVVNMTQQRQMITSRGGARVLHR